MGQAAGLTGGYGNSYAAAAGNQAYQQQLGQLAALAPQFYTAKANEYAQAGQQMMNTLSAFQGQEATKYGQYQDSVGNYYTGLGYKQNEYDMLSGQDLSQYQTGLGQYNTDREYLANQDYVTQQQANRDQEYAASIAKKSSGGGSSKKATTVNNQYVKLVQDAYGDFEDVERAVDVVSSLVDAGLIPDDDTATKTLASAGVTTAMINKLKSDKSRATNYAPGGR